MTTPTPNVRLLAVALGAAVACLPAAARAEAIVREVNFLGLHRAAGSILHGRCTARVEVRDALPVPYIEYTFKIASAPKGARDAAGEPLGTVTFRHACDRPGHVRPDGIEVAPLRLGIPEYRVGDELVLFLTKESDLGFCAPVGLLQGVFRVARTGKTAEVRNELRNQRLFERVSEEAFEGLAPEEQPAALKGREAVTLDHFLKLCRSVKE